jgi:hypothetical protein
MATTGDGAVRLVQVTAHELMSLGLAEVALETALELLHGGGYNRASEAQLQQIAVGVSRGAFAMPHLVADLAATTDEQLEDAARTLAALVVGEVLGPPSRASVQ